MRIGRRLWIGIVFAGCVAVGCGGTSDAPSDDAGDQGGGLDVIGDPGIDPGRSDLADPGMPQDPGNGEDPSGETVADEGAGDLGPACVDPDGDGYGPNCEAGPDCAPNDPLRFVTVSLYPDGDFDGFGIGDAVDVCIGAMVPAGWSRTNDDCDDTNAAVYPGAPEVADDGVANGCKGADLVAASADGVFVKPGALVDAAGTREDPIGSLSAAITKAKTAGVADIFVAAGDLNETLMIMQDVAIHGGYDATTWAKSGATRLLSSGPVAMRVLEAGLLLNRMAVYGFSNEGDTTPHLNISAIVVEEGSASIVDSTVGGGTLDASLTDSTVATMTGLWIVDSDVRVVRSNLGSGSPKVVEYSGKGTVERYSVATGILLESGSLRMAGGSLGYYGNVELWDIDGTAVAKTTVRGLKATGGRAILAALDIEGNAAVNVKEAEATEGTAHSTAEVDIASVEVSGGAHVQIVNSLVAAPEADTLAEAYGPETVAGDAVAESRVVSTGVVVAGGTLDMLHCVFYTERFTSADTDVSAPKGTTTVTTKVTVRLIDAGPGSRVRVVNTYGSHDVDQDDSSMIRVASGAHLRLVNNVMWDGEKGICRVHDGATCAIDVSDDLDNCATVLGCDAAVNNLVADPLYLWWDGVNPGSPLRDAGVDPATEGLGAPTDHAGNIRPQGEGWDIGAYEFAP